MQTLLKQRHSELGDSSSSTSAMPRWASVTNLTGQQQPEQDGNSASATFEAKLQVLNTTSAFSALPCLPVLPHTATYLPLQMYGIATTCPL